MRTDRLRTVLRRQRRQRQRARDARLDRVPDLRRPREPASERAAQERPREGVAGALLGNRQRKLGLRRQYDARILRRSLLPVSELHAHLQRYTDDEDCQWLWWQ